MKMVHHIHPTRNVCDGTWIKNNRAALPDYIFHEGEREEESIKDHQSDQPDVATVLENNDDSKSENAWSEREI